MWMATQNNKHPVSSPCSEEKTSYENKNKDEDRKNSAQWFKQRHRWIYLPDSIADKHNFIYCEGSCDRWLYRYWAGISKILLTYG